MLLMLIHFNCNFSKKCTQNASESFSGEGFFLFKDVEGMSNHQLVFFPTCKSKLIDSLDTFSEIDLGKGIWFLLYDWDDYLIKMYKNSKIKVVRTNIINFSDTTNVAFGYFKYHNAYNEGKKFDKIETYIDSLEFPNKNIYEIRYFSSSSEIIDTLIVYPLTKKYK